MNSAVTSRGVQIPVDYSSVANFDLLETFQTSYLKSAMEILTIGFNFLKLIPINHFLFDLKIL